MCGTQQSPSDGWARKSQWHTPRPDRVHSRREAGHAASCCPTSQSRGRTEPEGHSQVCSSDRVVLTPHAMGPHWLWFLMWRVVGFLPCCGPCSRTEARLHLSATVLRSTTLAGQPGHSPQPPRGAAGALGSTGRAQGARSLQGREQGKRLHSAGRGSGRNCLGGAAAQNTVEPKGMGYVSEKTTTVLSLV